MAVRRNVYELGSTWADDILWYARGVAAMKARALDDPTSWRFYGAIHGIDAQLWTRYGFLGPNDRQPSRTVVQTYWNQCQHASWFFLPWHRGYLVAFERVVRAAVVSLGGPSDWSLPYWNYFKTGQNALPPAFASQTWPDGGTNPLFVAQRYGPNGNGNVFVQVSMVNLNAMNSVRFTGVSTSPGFGGVDTGFSHSGRTHGALETQPHDWVHGLVGGARNNDPNQPGLMSDPDTAGLDPIFWLHHANIDRLWESWNRSAASHTNPTASKWLNWPPSAAQRGFVLPLPANGTYRYMPKDVLSLASLGYEYDDLTPTGAPAPRDVVVPATAAAAGAASSRGAAVANEEPRVELVGASDGSVPLSGSEAQATVRLDPGMRRRMADGLATARRVTPGGPSGDASGRTAGDEAAGAGAERVLLNLENVRGTADAAAFQVYVGLPAGADPAEHPENLAGSIAPFGLRKASLETGDHGGQGLNFVIDITDLVDRLDLDEHLGDRLDVRLVPLNPIAAKDELTVGLISVYREGD